MPNDDNEEKTSFDDEITPQRGATIHPTHGFVNLLTCYFSQRNIQSEYHLEPQKTAIAIMEAVQANRVSSQISSDHVVAMQHLLDLAGSELYFDKEQMAIYRQAHHLFKMAEINPAQHSIIDAILEPTFDSINELGASRALLVYQAALHKNNPCTSEGVALMGTGLETAADEIIRILIHPHPQNRSSHYWPESGEDAYSDYVTYRIENEHGALVEVSEPRGLLGLTARHTPLINANGTENPYGARPISTEAVHYYVAYAVNQQMAVHQETLQAHEQHSSEIPFRDAWMIHALVHQPVSLELSCATQNDAHYQLARCIAHDANISNISYHVAPKENVAPTEIAFDMIDSIQKNSTAHLSIKRSWLLHHIMPIVGQYNYNAMMALWTALYADKRIGHFTAISQKFMWLRMPKEGQILTSHPLAEAHFEKLAGMSNEAILQLTQPPFMIPIIDNVRRIQQIQNDGSIRWEELPPVATGEYDSTHLPKGLALSQETLLKFSSVPAKHLIAGITRMHVPGSWERFLKNDPELTTLKIRISLVQAVGKEHAPDLVQALHHDDTSHISGDQIHGIAEHLYRDQNLNQEALAAATALFEKDLRLQQIRRFMRHSSHAIDFVAGLSPSHLERIATLPDSSAFKLIEPPFYVARRYHPALRRMEQAMQLSDTQLANFPALDYPKALPMVMGLSGIDKPASWQQHVETDPDFSRLNLHMQMASTLLEHRIRYGTIFGIAAIAGTPNIPTADYPLVFIEKISTTLDRLTDIMPDDQRQCCQIAQARIKNDPRFMILQAMGQTIRRTDALRFALNPHLIAQREVLARVGAPKDYPQLIAESAVFSYLQKENIAPATLSPAKLDILLRLHKDQQQHLIAILTNSAQWAAFASASDECVAHFTKPGILKKITESAIDVLQIFQPERIMVEPQHMATSVIERVMHGLPPTDSTTEARFSETLKGYFGTKLTLNSHMGEVTHVAKVIRTQAIFATPNHTRINMQAVPIILLRQQEKTLPHSERIAKRREAPMPVFTRTG